MSNRQKRFLLVVLGFIVILLLVILLWPAHLEQKPPASAIAQATNATTRPPSLVPVDPASPTIAVGNPATARPGQHEYDNRAESEYLSLWRTSLLFYGKVIDENERPISGVRISYSANSVDETLTREVYNNGVATTDQRGIFKIDGVRGVGLTFQFDHPDYYLYSDNLTGFDIRSGTKSGIPPDGEEHAQLFRMHHKGNPVPLVNRHGGLHKPADGTIMDFPIRGKTRTEMIGQLQVQGWKGDPDPKNARYDWKVKLSVPGGGLLESTDEFGFVAPDAGYQPALEISESKDDPNWSPAADKVFFFKLPDYFVRGRANIDLYHDLYFSMRYSVNPDGSGNLENDPSRPFQEP